MFAVSDYYATGEGQTTSILITQACPHFGRDYEIEPSWDTEIGKYFPGKLKHSKAQITILEFIDRFGEYLSQCIEILSKEDFEKKYGYLIPEGIKNFINNTEDNQPANFFWASQFHTNYS